MEEDRSYIPDATEQLANAHVFVAEYDYLSELLTKALREQERYEACGCKNCGFGAEDAEREYYVEKFRVENPHEIDEEEEILRAIRRNDPDEIYPWLKKPPPEELGDVFE